MAYNNNPYLDSNQQRHNLPPLRAPAGYDQVAHPPASPRLDSAYDNSDIQDDPYSQNPNMPAGARFYGAGMQDYSRQSLAASEVSLHHPQGSQQHLGSPYADTPNGAGYSPSASFVKGYGGGNYDQYRDEPDSHEMAYRGDSRSNTEKGAVAGYGAEKQGKSRRTLWIIIAVVILLIAAAGVCVYLFIIKPKSDESTDGGSSPGKNNSTVTTRPYTFALTGGDGSQVLKDDNTTFVYHNALGGKWVYDPSKPFDDSAQAQKYTPPLSQKWDWSQRIRGCVPPGSSPFHDDTAHTFSSA